MVLYGLSTKARLELLTSGGIGDGRALPVGLLGVKGSYTKVCRLSPALEATLPLTRFCILS